MAIVLDKFNGADSIGSIERRIMQRLQHRTRR
jgi:hypothetical protein